MIEPEYWGLPATAWTAISAVGTLGAVIVALGLPIWQTIVRRKNLEAVILRELALNQRTLLEAVEPPTEDVVPFATGSLPPTQMVWVRLQTLYNEGWKRHRESVAELSYSRFTFYDEANQRIEMIRARALENRDLNDPYMSLDFTLNIARECLVFLSKAPGGIRARLLKESKKK